MTYPKPAATVRTLSALLLIAASALACNVDRVASGEDSITAESCEQTYSWRECDQNIDPELDGVQVCVEGESGNEWTACEPHYFDKGPDDCSDAATWDGQCCQTMYGCCESDPVCMTPLVLSFDHKPVQFQASNHSFDLTRNHMSVATDWPASTTPWLVLDRNGNGRIDNGSELFGSATQLGSKAFARNGFEALAQLDDNQDGLINAADKAWANLQLWTDRDADRVSSAAELTSLDSQQLIAIDLDYRKARRCDARGNCEAERAGFWFRGDAGQVRSGTVVDVHLAAQ